MRVRVNESGETTHQFVLFSSHFKRRLKERGISFEEVREVIERGEREEMLDRRVQYTLKDLVVWAAPNGLLLTAFRKTTEAKFLPRRT